MRHLTRTPTSLADPKTATLADSGLRRQLGFVSDVVVKASSEPATIRAAEPIDTRLRPSTPQAVPLADQLICLDGESSSPTTEDVAG